MNYPHIPQRETFGVSAYAKEQIKKAEKRRAIKAIIAVIIMLAGVLLLCRCQ